MSIPPPRRMPPRPARHRPPMAKLKTGFATASLVLGIVGLFTAGLVIIGSVVGIVLGIIAIIRASNSPSQYGGRGSAIAGVALNCVAILVMPFVFGIIAAIAIPSLLRARVSTNEAQNIALVREIASGQAGYSQANAGLYDELACLQNPQQCIPGYPPTGPGFVGEQALAPNAAGYQRELYLGPPPASRPETASPSGATSFVFVAIPTDYNVTGTRGFCTDASGIVCTFDGDAPPDLSTQTCPTNCNALQ